MAGFCEKDYQLNKQIGITKTSFGYKADGKIYNNKGTGEEYGPKFELNDVIGYGLNIAQKTIFFTFNGRNLGPAFTKVEFHPE